MANAMCILKDNLLLTGSIYNGNKLKINKSDDFHMINLKGIVNDGFNAYLYYHNNLKIDSSNRHECNRYRYNSFYNHLFKMNHYRQKHWYWKKII